MPHCWFENFFLIESFLPVIFPRHLTYCIFLRSVFQDSHHRFHWLPVDERPSEFSFVIAEGFLWITIIAQIYSIPLFWIRSIEYYPASFLQCKHFLHLFRYQNGIDRCIRYSINYESIMISIGCRGGLFIEGYLVAIDGGDGVEHIIYQR